MIVFIKETVTIMISSKRIRKIILITIIITITITKPITRIILFTLIIIISSPSILPFPFQNNLSGPSLSALVLATCTA